MSGTFDQHLALIKADLAADPIASLAISFDVLGGAPDSHAIGLDLVEEFVAAIDPGTLEGELAEDVSVFRDAMAILNGRAPILGMGYGNFSLNVTDCGWELSEFGPASCARDLINRITAAAPRLGQIIRDRPALVPF